MPNARTREAYKTSRRAASDRQVLVNPRFAANAEALIRRVEKSGNEYPNLLIAQNAPRGIDPDGPALAAGTDTRKRAAKILDVRDSAFDRLFAINALQEEPELYRSAVDASLHRMEWSIERLIVKERLARSITLVGANQRDAFARLVGLRSDVRLPWCVGMAWGDIPVVAVPHPSGLNRIYNSAEERARAARFARPLVLGEDEEPDWLWDAPDLEALYAGRFRTRKRK